jgi:putative DNA primase/helicase
VKLAMGITGLSFKDAAREIERLAGGAARDRQARPQRRGQARRLAPGVRESKPIQRGDEAEPTWLGGAALHDLPEAVRVHPGLRYQDGGTGTYPRCSPP